MSETSERKKTSEAAKELGISENTLRKYSKIVEEVTGNPAYFAHQKNARLYSPEDLEKLRQLVARSKEPGQTLLQAAAGIFAKENPEKIAQVVASLQKTIESQNQVIDSLKEELSSLKEAQKPAAPADNVLGWDDIPDLPADDADEEADLDLPLTPEQKRERVVADMHRSDEEVHRALMDKVQEHAQKAAPTHRTLADMQLKPKKRPWWKRIF